MKKLIPILFVFILVFAGCKKGEAPAVDFTFTNDGCTASCSITFTNTTIDGNTFTWDFGDGQSSGDANPAPHSYSQAGTYHVTLSSKNDNGTSSKTHDVLIQDPTQTQLPSASFTINNNGCTGPCTISFTNSSQYANSYSWDFGDGSYPSTESNPSHVYSNNGSYNVTLTATNSLGNNQCQHSVTINNNPCAGVTCLNGGNCVNGTCNCPPGYTGSNCGTEMTPTSMKITKIVLNSYPMTDPNGYSWDVDGGPDIFLSINQGTSANDVQFTGIANNQSGGSITFTTNFPTTLSPSSSWTIYAWDYDVTSADDPIGGYAFIPNNYHNGFPSTLHFNSGNVAMTIYVTWNF